MLGAGRFFAHWLFKVEVFSHKTDNCLDLDYLFWFGISGIYSVWMSIERLLDLHALALTVSPTCNINVPTPGVKLPVHLVI